MPRRCRAVTREFWEVARMLLYSCQGVAIQLPGCCYAVAVVF